MGAGGLDGVLSSGRAVCRARVEGKERQIRDKGVRMVALGRSLAEPGKKQATKARRGERGVGCLRRENTPMEDVVGKKG